MEMMKEMPFRCGVTPRVAALALLLLAGTAAAQQPAAPQPAAPQSAAQQAATVLATEGTVYVERAEAGKRVIVSRGSLLMPGDTLHTGRDSTARVKFTDTSDLGVRASSSLTIDAYRFVDAEPEQDSLVIRLLKGGMRQLSGVIGKRGNADAYRLRTATATIGIRGTDFTARICDGDCAAEGQKLAATAGSRPINNNPRPVVARVVEVGGRLTAQEPTGTERKLAKGSPVYVGDTLDTDAAGPAVIAFADQSRIVVDRSSLFKVERFRYASDAPRQDGMALQMLRGGLRVLTGLIARRSPASVSVTTSTATIGIRGTNFDLFCAAAGSADAKAPEPARVRDASCDGALYAQTRDGAISVRSGDGQEIVLARGEAGVVAGPGVAPARLDQLPAEFRQRELPQPEDFPADLVALFGEDGAKKSDPGLYLLVREGQVELAPEGGKPALLDAGESGYLAPTGDQVLRFSSVPQFIERDPLLSDRIIGYGVCRP